MHIRKFWLPVVLVGLAAFIVAGCTGATVVPLDTNQGPTPDRPVPSLPPGQPQQVPTEPPAAPITGETPDSVLNPILSDLAAQLGVDQSAITVIQSASVTWNNGSLGCPEPGMMYTEALVNGYHVILEVDGVQYDYRATETGYFLQCKNTNGGIVPPSKGGVTPVNPSTGPTDGTPDS
jgi:hypothetical protein